MLNRYALPITIAICPLGFIPVPILIQVYESSYGCWYRYRGTDLHWYWYCLLILILLTDIDIDTPSRINTDTKYRVMSPVTNADTDTGEKTFPDTQYGHLDGVKRVRHLELRTPIRINCWSSFCWCTWIQQIIHWKLLQYSFTNDAARYHKEERCL